MVLDNTSRRYGAFAVMFHWAMAALLVGLLLLGWYMVLLPDAGFDRTKITLILAHKALGMLALTAAALRLAWRTVTTKPDFEATIPGWQQTAAYFAHYTFYALMFALPLTGWLMSSAGGYPVYLFVDRALLPDLIPQNPQLFRFFIDLHRWLAYALMGVLLVHAGAALAHHFVWRDDTLRKMLP